MTCCLEHECTEKRCTVCGAGAVALLVGGAEADVCLGAEDGAHRPAVELRVGDEEGRADVRQLRGHGARSDACRTTNVSLQDEG